MEKYNDFKKLALNIAFYALVPAILSATPTKKPLTPEQQEIVQRQRTWRAEKTQDLARLGDDLRSRINPLTDVLKKPQTIADAKKRKQALEWAQSINKNVFQLVEKLHANQIPSIQVLKESAVMLASYIDMLHEGLTKQLPQEIMARTSLEKEAITKKLETLSTELSAHLTRTLDAQRTSLSPDQQALLPSKIEGDMVDVAMIEQFTVAIAQGLENLSELIKDYGITGVNRVTRAIDKFARKVWHNDYVPYITVPAFFLSAGLIAYGISQIQGHHFPNLPGGMWGDVLHGSMTTALSTGGGYLFTKAWTPTQKDMSELYNRFSIWWKKMQGITVKEKVNGVEILKPEDCEGEKEPLIGLETPFKRVMESIESALNRISIGEREPLKGIQRTFVFIAPAGMGKTFLMEQLKHRIAQLQQFGMPIAYENISGEQLVFGDLVGRIKEAQQKNMGLVLWIDEMHLYKPMKDGNTPLLSQLLQTEFVNKSNTPIWIFTATNEPGRFDNALIRSGRFEVINIYEPTFHDRVELFKHYLREQGMVVSPTDLKIFAAQTHGASPATIRKVINSAHASGRALTRDLVQEKILEFVFKIVPGFELLHEKERREIAAYRSAQLLLHVLNLLEYSKNARNLFLSGELFALATAAGIEKSPQELASIIMENTAHNPNFGKNRRYFGNVFTYNGRDDAHANGTDMRVKEKELFISELLAGACGQEIYLKDTLCDMKKDDFKRAFEACLELEGNGIPLNLMSKHDEQECRKKALIRFAAAKARALELIKEHLQVFKVMVSFMLQAKECPHITAIDVLLLMEKKAEQAKPDPDVKQEATSSDTLPVTLAAA